MLNIKELKKAYFEKYGETLKKAYFEKYGKTLAEAIEKCDSIFDLASDIMFDFYCDELGGDEGC